MKLLLKYFLALLLIIPGSACFAQGRHTDSSGISGHKGRIIGVGVSAGTLYAGSMAGLYSIWYADYPKGSFHFIDDSRDWMGIDKAGHFTSAYWIGRIGFQSLKWAGVDEKKSIWYGGTWGLVYLTTVEIFDGFSAEWGASAVDIAANTGGTLLMIGQQLAWHDQRIILKFSYHPTKYAQYRPDILGENGIQRLLKDYNGHTYWISGNIRSFLGSGTGFPAWLNIALGYSSEGMLGGTENPSVHNGESLPHFKRYPQFFLSLDADLTKIRTKSELLRLIFNAIGFVKIPFPALEFNPIDKARFHWIYF